MPNREIYNNYNESVRIAQTQWTDFSAEATVTIAQDITTPSVCTLVATSADQSIDLTITPPTTNTDGTSIVDLKNYTIYYSTSSGIDITNPATYSGTFNTTSTQHTFPTSAKTYFVCQCNDKWSNSSAGSSEVNATPTVAGGVPVSVDDYTANISQVLVGKTMIGTEFQPPKSSWERWAGFKLYTADDGGLGAGSLPADPTTLIYTGSGGCFLHKGLNESYLYEYKLVVLGEDGTTTSGTISDNSGAGYQPNAADNSALLAETIMAERIFATTELYAQDAVIGASGSLRSGQTAYNTGIGWWMGDAAGTPKFSLGNPAGKWLTMDGTNFAWSFGNCSMDTSGNLTATSVTLTGAFTATSGTVGSFTIGTYLYTGSKTAYNDANAGVHLGSDGIGIGNNLFTVSAAGAVNATNLTITGGSININSGVFTVSAAGAVVASSISCTNLTVGAGSSWGGNVLGTAYIPNLSATKITTDTLVVARTEAKCTNALADQTSANTANNASNYTGNSISTTYTAAKCTDPNADQTSTHTAADTAKVQGSTIIIGGYIGTSFLTASNIQAGTMSVGRILIDGNINFKPSTTLYKIHGMDTLYFGPDGLSSGMRIGRSASGGHLSLFGNDIYLEAAIDIDINSAGDIILDSGDDIILDVADADYPMYIKDWWTTGGAQGTAAGRVKLISNGITRYLRLYT